MSQTASTLIAVRPSRVARRLLFHLFAVGTGRIDKEKDFAAFEKPGIGLFWLQSGSGTVTLRTGTWELHPLPKLYLYAAGQARTFVCKDKRPLVTKFLWFGGPGLEAWMEELNANRNPVIELRNPAVISGAHAKLVQLVKRRSQKWEWKIHLTMIEILQELFDAGDLLSHNEKTIPREITQALNALEANPLRDWHAQELAVEAGLSYSSFRVLFRQHMGETPHEYIQRVRVDLARELLSDRRLRIKEVAQKLHFANDHYFSSFFRGMTGMSPTEFRKHIDLESA